MAVNPTTRSKGRATAVRFRPSLLSRPYPAYRGAPLGSNVRVAERQSKAREVAHCRRARAHWSVGAAETLSGSSRTSNSKHPKPPSNASLLYARTDRFRLSLAAASTFSTGRLRTEAKAFARGFEACGKAGVQTLRARFEYHRSTK